MSEETAIDTAAHRIDESAEYARVEIMGHRERLGRIEEVERFGAKFLRVYSQDEEGEPRIEDYSGGSIFSVSQVPKVVVDAHHAAQARRREEYAEACRRRRERLALTAPDDGDGVFITAEDLKPLEDDDDDESDRRQDDRESDDY